MFDVTNPAAPQRLAVLGFGPSATTVGQDSARVPVLGQGEPRRAAAAELREDDPGFLGAAGIRVGANTLTDAGRVRHASADHPRVPVERSFVIGDRLYTLSYLGLSSNAVSTLSGLSYTAF